MSNLQKTNEQKIAFRTDFGEIYFKERNGQFLRPVQAQMVLFEKSGHIYKIKKDDWAITSTGYVHLNKVASINIVTPQYVIVDGVQQPNPYVERNPRTKAIETVNVRKIGIGYSPIGNITVVDKTLFYNVYTYLIQSIQAKMKKREWNNKSNKPDGNLIYPDCAKTGTKNDRPAEGSWAFFETAEPLGLWVNYEDSAIIECLDEHTQRQRFGDRIAQKIVERNILKDHPAIGISKVDIRTENNLNKAYVKVYGFRHDLEPPDLENITEQAERGSQTVEIHTETIEEVSHEEESRVVEEAAEDEKNGARNV